MNKEHKEAYVPPMLVKHELLRGITAQLDELFQLGSRLTGLTSSTKPEPSTPELAPPVQDHPSPLLNRRSDPRVSSLRLMRGN